MKIDSFSSDNFMISLSFFVEAIKEVFPDLEDNQILYVDFYCKDTFGNYFYDYVEFNLDNLIGTEK